MVWFAVKTKLRKKLHSLAVGLGVLPAANGAFSSMSCKQGYRAWRPPLNGEQKRWCIRLRNRSRRPALHLGGQGISLDEQVGPQPADVVIAQPGLGADHPEAGWQS